MTYPKLKYKGVEVKQGQHHTENPGYIYTPVADPDAEAELGEGWYDTPREAIDAFGVQSRAARDEEERLRQARERGAVPAGAQSATEHEPAGGADLTPKGGKDKGVEDALEDPRPSRQTGEWPKEREAKKK